MSAAGAPLLQSSTGIGQLVNGTFLPLELPGGPFSPPWGSFSNGALALVRNGTAGVTLTNRTVASLRADWVSLSRAEGVLLASRVSLDSPEPPYSWGTNLSRAIAAWDEPDLAQPALDHQISPALSTCPRNFTPVVDPRSPCPVWNGSACAGRGMCALCTTFGVAMSICACDEGHSGADCASCKLGYVHKGKGSACEAVGTVLQAAYASVKWWAKAVIAVCTLMLVAAGVGGAFVAWRRAKWRAPPKLLQVTVSGPGDDDTDEFAEEHDTSRLVGN